jgi:hypothetical protein
MTVKQLTDYFNQNYGMFKAFPETYEVDADTYADVCHHLFLLKATEMEEVGIEPIKFFAKVWLGKHNGVLFKGVELILKGKEE